MCLLTIAQPRNRLIRVLPPMTGAALRRDGSYLRCKVCSAVPRRGKLRGYLSSANIFRRGDVWGWGETTGEVEEAQSILFSAFVCIGSLLGVW